MDWFTAGEYEIARQILQRGVAACFMIAFVSTIKEFPALLGERGLLPVPRFVARVPFRRAPSIFHWRYSDFMLLSICWVGVVFSAFLIIGIPQQGPPWAPMIVFLFLWASYLSIVNVGQTFYSFGWESLLLEAGFVVAFLGSPDVAPPITIVIFVRWIVFRLEFGAGMIKIRGGSEWRDLTALFYHHQTQPMPNPVSWYVHHLPPWFHRGEVLGNHVAQLLVPFFLFAPQPIASVAAVIVIATQLWLVLTGNFAWLNWITIVLTFSAIDDATFRAVLGVVPASAPAAAPAWFMGSVLLVTAFLLVLSWAPMRNLFTRGQLMNASFNRYHLVNAYGAFGTVTRVRYEVIVEGNDDAAPGPNAAWQEYGFRAKPGDPRRMPPQVAPYHLRLDWLMWFLALGSRDTRWFEVFLLRLLQADRTTLRLLRHNPYPDHPPRWIRARLCEYRYSTRAEKRATGAWWVRSDVGMLVQPVAYEGGPSQAGRNLPP
ncbi:lipase maturation factor family protein [Cryobacterium psychrophilum]|uniref:Lipase maturation factor family protein n=1 Tax=Cryobacterium psychrophilum TaxID=41988 RepID=A0A4Y8KQS9_9MICO|nr:lipase maturation factor family protein [Cryobacterium psychrophilum]TDW31462.1 lipase maturation factor [Cryobacterium psychrophilum]TFD78896.1 lipase maturation factor family protein [Cryobacterium psychrophilum]